MATKKGSPVLWLLVSMTLGGLAVRYYEDYQAQPKPTAPSASAVPTLSVPSPVMMPYDWPTVRWLDQVSGEWVGESGEKITITSKRSKKTRDWTIVFIGVARGAGQDNMTCDVSPELKDGGFHGTCVGYGQEADNQVFFRLHMNLERRLHVESSLFSVTAKSKGSP